MKGIFKKIISSIISLFNRIIDQEAKRVDLFNRYMLETRQMKEVRN